MVFSAYAIYFHAETGRWGFTGAENQVLYGRTAVVADCAKLPLNEGTKLSAPRSHSVNVSASTSTHTITTATPTGLDRYHPAPPSRSWPRSSRGW